MTTKDLELLTPTELAVWAQLGDMEPPRVACAVERVLANAVETRKATPLRVLEGGAAS